MHKNELVINEIEKTIIDKLERNGFKLSIIRWYLLLKKYQYTNKTLNMDEICDEYFCMQYNECFIISSSPYGYELITYSEKGEQLWREIITRYSTN